MTRNFMTANHREIIQSKDEPSKKNSSNNREITRSKDKPSKRNSANHREKTRSKDESIKKNSANHREITRSKDKPAKKISAQLQKHSLKLDSTSTDDGVKVVQMKQLNKPSPKATRPALLKRNLKVPRTMANSRQASSSLNSLK